MRPTRPRPPLLATLSLCLAATPTALGCGDDGTTTADGGADTRDASGGGADGAGPGDARTAPDGGTGDAPPSIDARGTEPICGDGTCGAGETCGSCTIDCDACPTDELRAFPTAEGYGAHTPGGRAADTRVLFVTHTGDDGEGSLRAAIEASGPRIVIFRTGGTIELASSLEIRNGQITIAGQTAPGGGIAIKNGTSTDSTMKLKASDIILRGLRVRPGPGQNVGDEPDGLWIDGSQADQIIIDHCSFSWSVDENLSMTATRNVTVQWSIIAEGLRFSTHSNGSHSRGLFLTGNNTGISVHHNLLAHHRRRMPFIVGDAGQADFVNNVVYNWGNDDSPNSYAGRINDGMAVNYIGNHISAGPSSNDAYPIESNSGSPSIYVSGNFSAEYRTADTDPEDWVVTPGDRGLVVPDPVSTVTLRTQSAVEARALVLAGAGATMPSRDSADTRVVADATNGTGAIIDDPGDVGGYPTLAAGSAPADGDDDGMPDAFETANGLDPGDPTDALETTLSVPFTGVDGYLNVEVYINSLLAPEGA